MSTELKIKLKSLAEESRIIRKEELLSKPNIDKINSLHDHRIHVVRPVARATHLAYGLLNGLDYRQIENHNKTVPDWKKVEAMVKKYADDSKREMFLGILNSWKLECSNATRLAA